MNRLNQRLFPNQTKQCQWFSVSHVFLFVACCFVFGLGLFLVLFLTFGFLTFGFLTFGFLTFGFLIPYFFLFFYFYELQTNFKFRPNPSPIVNFIFKSKPCVVLEKCDQLKPMAPGIKEDNHRTSLLFPTSAPNGLVLKKWHCSSGDTLYARFRFGRLVATASQYPHRPFIDNVKIYSPKFQDVCHTGEYWYNIDSRVTIHKMFWKEGTVLTANMAIVEIYQSRTKYSNAPFAVACVALMVIPIMISHLKNSKTPPPLL
jgi:hypothetical protein